jgi:hypothetical protein
MHATRDATADDGRRRSVREEQRCRERRVDLSDADLCQHNRRATQQSVAEDNAQNLAILPLLKLGLEQGQLGHHGGDDRKRRFVRYHCTGAFSGSLSGCIWRYGRV